MRESNAIYTKNGSFKLDSQYFLSPKQKCASQGLSKTLTLFKDDTNKNWDYVHTAPDEFPIH